MTTVSENSFWWSIKPELRIFYNVPDLLFFSSYKTRLLLVTCPNPPHSILDIRIIGYPEIELLNCNLKFNICANIEKFKQLCVARKNKSTAVLPRFCYWPETWIPETDFVDGWRRPASGQSSESPAAKTIRLRTSRSHGKRPQHCWTVFVFIFRLKRLPKHAVGLIMMF